MKENPTQQLPDGIELVRLIPPLGGDILSPRALAFIASLEREFRTWRATLLERRFQRQKEIDEGALPDFSFSQAALRKGSWRVADIPHDLLDRRVEITGPPDRKMVINAMNSGANAYMADFEDALSPTWTNLIEGQRNIRDAIRRTIEYTSPPGDQYRLKETTATLMVRPRGLHLPEQNVLIDEKPVSASIFDFGLFFFHNARELIERGSGPYVYIPKLEHHQEARWWNTLFELAQDVLRIPRGTVRATVLIETLHAAFEMDEILYELRDHSAGLNCGRWDYIFSCIKTLRKHDRFVFPDRNQLTMNTRFLRGYSQLLIQTCHRRGIHAIGGMAAQIPIKNNPEANKTALKKVRLDKEREVLDGHDGTWVAHPALVPLARNVFDSRMTGPNQIHVKRNDIYVTAKDLYDIPDGSITVRSISKNVSVALQYLASWLSGNGCVPINDLMEDTATAEICRIQLWHWLHHPAARLSDGAVITRKLYKAALSGELAKLQHELGPGKFHHDRFALATTLLDSIVLHDPPDEFLTLRGNGFLN